MLELTIRRRTLTDAKTVGLRNKQASQRMIEVTVEKVLRQSETDYHGGSPMSSVVLGKDRKIRHRHNKR